MAGPRLSGSWGGRYDRREVARHATWCGAFWNKVCASFACPTDCICERASAPQYQHVNGIVVYAGMMRPLYHCLGEPHVREAIQHADHCPHGGGHGGVQRCTMTTKEAPKTAPQINAVMIIVNNKFQDIINISFAPVGPTAKGVLAINAGHIRAGQIGAGKVSAAHIAR
jgi:hypothetical protein